MTGSIEEQRAWAQTSALAVAAPERCVLEVTGQDRLSWLNGLLTCELASRKPGEAVHGLAVTQKGKIISDVVVLVGDERALLVVQRRTLEPLMASFEHHLMMEDAELSRSDPALAWFLHGPRAGEVLAAARARAGLPGGALDVTGHGGAITVTRGEAEETALLDAVRVAGGGAGDDPGWNVVRVLAGVPRFDVDFDDTTYPQEAGLESSAVSFQKGCYLGQEVVCMLEMRGHVKRKLVQLEEDGDVIPSPKAAVDDGKGVVIGQVTSAALGDGGMVRALAMVKYAFIGKGTEVRVLGHLARVV